MRWGKRFLLLSCALAFFLLSATLAAYGQPAPSLLQPKTNWNSLDALLTQLETESTQLQAELTALSNQLQESKAQAESLRQQLEQSELHLTNYALSMKAQKARLVLELWLWRIGTVAGVFGTLFFLFR